MRGLLRHLRPSVPLERREKGILALFAVVTFTQGWTGAVLTHALPFVRDSFLLDDGRVFGMLSTVRAVALIGLMFSWWGDHRGRRTPLLVAFLMLGAFNLATAFAPSYPVFLWLQAGARVGGMALAALTVVVLAEELNPGVRGYGLAVAALFTAMGTGFGLFVRILGGRSAEGWRLLFALSAIPILVLPFLAKRLRESRAYRQRAARPPLAEVFRAGMARHFWPMALLSMAVSAFTAPAANLALVRMENELGWSAGAGSLMLALTSAPGVILGLLAGGRMADLIGRRPTEVASAFVGVSGGILFYFSTNPWLMAVGIFVSMVGSFAFGPAFGAHRTELFPTRIRATAGAWMVNASILGGLLGFAAGRFVVDAWGIPITIASLGAMLLAATSLVLLVPETRGIDLTLDDEGGPTDWIAATPV
ncbi:MAG: MFS transporter [Actinobacteria bacterium]|nr:MFS transporter [Actinomycetota bacterium]MBU1494437.1 MFS transporter [Actinomycetota bacterium]